MFLTEKEVDELVKEWKPEPLTPPPDVSACVLPVVVGWIGLNRSRSGAPHTHTPWMDRLISHAQCPSPTPPHPTPHTPQQPEWEEEVELVVDAMEGSTVQVGKKRLVNFAGFDFLGLGGRPEVKEAARAALDKYGCGSCGPRGFYGTIDVHVEAEEAVARFMGAEEAISYSDAASVGVYVCVCGLLID